MNAYLELTRVEVLYLAVVANMCVSPLPRPNLVKVRDRYVRGRTVHEYTGQSLISRFGLQVPSYPALREADRKVKWDLGLYAYSC
jgi:hypothetical protein